MKFLILALLSFSALASSSMRDLSVEKLARGTCGTLATAMTERVYNTNRDMRKEYYITPVFKKDVDFEMMRFLKLLVSESEKFTATTPDSQRLSPMLSAFEILSGRNFRYAKECLAIYRPAAKKCYATYEKGTKEAFDDCVIKSTSSEETSRFVQKFFLRLSEESP